LVAARDIRDAALGDQTIPAGEVYAGKLQFEAPSTGKSGTRVYAITIRIGGDQHEILVYHGNQVGR